MEAIGQHDVHRLVHEGRLFAGNLGAHVEDARSEHLHSASFEIIFHVVSAETVLKIASSFANGRLGGSSAVPDFRHPKG